MQKYLLGAISNDNFSPKYKVEIHDRGKRDAADEGCSAASGQ